MGLPGAGKTTLAETYVTRGYLRLNRDDAGGSLNALIPALEEALAAGHTQVVLDNTYVSRKSRAPMIAAASRWGAAVRAASGCRRRSKTRRSTPCPAASRATAGCSIPKR